MPLSPLHKYAVFLSGRGSNLSAILSACKSGALSQKPSLVVTDNPDAPGLLYARENGVETLLINPQKQKGRKAYGEQIIKELEKRGIDTICLAGFMRIIHKNVVEKFRGKILNIHPSLLPAFPGLSAQSRALEAGARESGCSVHLVDEGVDTGPIIMQATVKVEEGDTLEKLSQKILRQEHRIYPIVIQALLDERIKISGGKAVIEK